MATRYVRSTDGSDADNGTTWALAKATLTGVAAIDTAGDTIWVSDNHAESTAGAVNLNFAGTAASPSKVLCGDDSAEPPTALATTATVTTTGNSTITVFSGGGYGLVHGVSFIAGSGASGAASISLGGVKKTFDSCNFTLGTTDTGSRITPSTTGAGYALIKNCGFKFSSASQGLAVQSGNSTGLLHIQGGSLLAGGTSPTALFPAPAANAVFLVEGFDLSNASAGVHLVSSTSAGTIGKFRNCKLPASWSGSLNSSTAGAGSVFEMFNCDAGDTNYRYRKSAEIGTIQDETTIVLAASDGTTTWSLKMVSNTGASYPLNTLDTPEITQWNETTGSPITVTVEIARDGTATKLTDAEIWLEVQYLGTSGFPLGSFISDAVATVIASAADQADSVAAWAGLGGTNCKQALSVTFTPEEKGVIHAVVRLAKASATVYVDPVLTVS